MPRAQKTCATSVATSSQMRHDVLFPDAYLALQEAQEAGKIRLKSYAENSEKTLHWLAKTIRQEYDASSDAPDYRRFLKDKFSYLLYKKG